MEKLRGRKKNIRRPSEIEKRAHLLFEMIKYAHRGPNLGAFFLRRGNLQSRMGEEEIRVILVLNGDELN